MQKWEYLQVETFGNGRYQVPMKIDGQELRDWKKGPSIPEFLFQMGEQGWELVALGERDMLYILKRPKS